jgi:hypothetical protein
VIPPFDAAAGASGTPGVITSVASGIAGLMAAFSAYRVARRTNSEDENKQLKGRVADLEADLLDFRNWAYGIRSNYADHGVTIPAPPVLRSDRSA